MRSFLMQAFWLSSFVSAQQVITITEHRKCSTSTSSTVPSSAASTFNSTQGPSLPVSTGSTSTSSASSPRLGALGPGAAASTAQQNRVDFLFWLEFANVIRTGAGIQPSDNTAFFVGSNAQTGPLAGDNIAEGYTNQGIYQLSNNLLNDSSIFYSPASSNNYFDALSNYLDYVDLEIQPTEQQENNLVNWNKDLAAAQDKMVREKKAAVLDYKSDVELGVYKADDWARWLEDGNGQLYTTALNRVNEITSKIDQLQAQINGAKARSLREKRLGIGKASSDIPNPGYNMPASTGSSLSLAQIRMCQDLLPAAAAKECPPPATFNVPLYDAQGYKEFVREALKSTPEDYIPKGGETFTVDSKKTTSQYDFGQTSVGADVSGGWFSPWSASGKHTTTSETFSSTAAAKSVSIKITWDDIRAITITPGQWDFNYRDFKLRSDAPNFLKQLIKPTQLIVATRVGYEITVGDQLATAINKHFTETTEAGGGFRIFGITIGASASHTTESETHEATFDSVGKTLKVVPRNVYGAATLLGIVGEKISI